MKRLLTIPCLLLLYLVIVGIIPAGATVPGITDSLLSPALPGTQHIAGYEEGSAPAIITIGFGILVIYALYRYWADGAGHKAD